MPRCGSPPGPHIRGRTLDAVAHLSYPSSRAADFLPLAPVSARISVLNADRFHSSAMNEEGFTCRCIRRCCTSSTIDLGSTRSRVQQNLPDAFAPGKQLNADVVLRKSAAFYKSLQAL